MAKFKNLIGKKFNKLTVIARAEDHIEPSGRKRIMWVCQCECGNIKIIPSSRLPRTLSCGCATIEANKHRIKHKKEKPIKEKSPKNLYDLSGEYGIGYTAKGEEFWFDLEDYDKIKNYCWYFKRGYLVAKINYKHIQFHNLIMNFIPSDNPGYVVDHIIHPNMDQNKFDNRKANLRIVTYHQNSANRCLNKNNKSGKNGVHYNKKAKKWIARISVQGKRICLGSYNNLEEAIKVRDQAEIKYYKKNKFLNKKEGK